MPKYKLNGQTFDLKFPAVMGILNLTPDSFSDGGKFLAPEIATQEAFKMIEQGAQIIDLGGESTRPGSNSVSVEEELSRILPVLKKLPKDKFILFPLKLSLITPWILAISISSLPSSFPCIKVSDPTSSTNSTLSFMGPFSSILKSSGLRPTFTFPLNFEIVFNEDWLEKVTILFLQSPFNIFIAGLPINCAVNKVFGLV